MKTFVYYVVICCGSPTFRIVRLLCRSLRFRQRCYLMEGNLSTLNSYSHKNYHLPVGTSKVRGEGFRSGDLQSSDERLAADTALMSAGSEMGKQCMMYVYVFH